MPASAIRLTVRDEQFRIAATSSTVSKERRSGLDGSVATVGIEMGVMSSIPAEVPATASLFVTLTRRLCF